MSTDKMLGIGKIKYLYSIQTDEYVHQSRDTEEKRMYNGYKKEKAWKESHDQPL